MKIKEKASKVEKALRWVNIFGFSHGSWPLIELKTCPIVAPCRDIENPFYCSFV